MRKTISLMISKVERIDEHACTHTESKPETLHNDAEQPRDDEQTRKQLNVPSPYALLLPVLPSVEALKVQHPTSLYFVRPHAQYVVQPLQKRREQQRNESVVLIYGVCTPDDDKKHGDAHQRKFTCIFQHCKSAVARKPVFVRCGCELHRLPVSTRNQLP